MNNLELRIIQLEKQARFYRILFLAMMLIAGAFLFMSFNQKKTVPDVLEARKIQVVDHKGSVVVELTSSDFTGNGEINTYTPQNKRLISLFTSDGGSGAINTFDKDQVPVFKLTQTTGGGGYMALMNAKAREIVEFGSTDNSSGYMRINDHNARKLAWITYTQGGGGYFSLASEGKETIRLSTSAKGGRIGMYNNIDSRIVFLGAQDNGDGNITIYNNAGAKFGSIPQ